MGDKTKGIHGKFYVERTDGRDGPGEKHENCDYYVLDLQHDKYAQDALIAYAKACRYEYPQLAQDIEDALPVPLKVGLAVQVCNAEGTVVRTGKVIDPGGPDFDLTAATNIVFEDGTRMYFHPYTLQGETHTPGYRPDPMLLPAEGLHLEWATRLPGWRKKL